MDTMRIYVACLASYNNGRHHGAWFDLDDYVDAEDLSKAVKEQVMITSPYPNVMDACPDCRGSGNANTDPSKPDGCLSCGSTGEVPSAEEWAIHDHEGFPEGSVGEYTSFDKLYEIRERIAEAEEEFGDDGQDILEAFEYCFGANDTPISTIREAYEGQYESGKDFSYDKAESLGEIPEGCDLSHYIDWEHVWNARDRHSYSEHNGHFFRSDW